MSDTPTQHQAISHYRYLQALGIAHYVSVLDLPGAAPSIRLAAPVAAPAIERSASVNKAPEAEAFKKVPAEGTLQNEVAVNQPVLLAEPSRGVLSAPSSAASEPAPEPEQFEVSHRHQKVISFRMAAVVAGPYLWLEELVQGVLAREQVVLIQAICRALGVLDRENSSRPLVARFEWPMHHNRQLDLGEEAARVALGSFIRRQMDEQHCEALVLLGERSRERLHEAPVEKLLIETFSTLQMLAEPACKARVWQDLQPLRRAQ
ncbi:MAG: hypothetical protein ACK5ME_01055 [Parahaliea sp.]